MSESCYKCGFKTIFFVWSSTRGFPRELLIDKTTTEFEERGLLCGRIGVPVCLDCAKKMGYPKCKKENTIKELK